MLVPFPVSWGQNLVLSTDLVGGKLFILMTPIVTNTIILSTAYINRNSPTVGPYHHNCVQGRVELRISVPNKIIPKSNFTERMFVPRAKVTVTKKLTVC